MQSESFNSLLDIWKCDATWSLVFYVLLDVLFGHILSTHYRNSKAANVVLDICVQRR